MSKLERVSGWPEKLAGVVATAQDQPYVLGVWDCLRFSCTCIRDMTGVDYWPRFEGYRTRREALVTIKKISKTLAGAVTKVLEIEPQEVVFSKRGDLVLYHDGEDHLGICIGASVAVLGAEGLEYVPITDKRLMCSWSIG